MPATQGELQIMTAPVSAERALTRPSRKWSYGDGNGKKFHTTLNLFYEAVLDESLWGSRLDNA